MATHTSILAWRIPWTEEPGGLWSIQFQRVRYDWGDLVCTRARWQTNGTWEVYHFLLTIIMAFCWTLQSGRRTLSPKSGWWLKRGGRSWCLWDTLSTSLSCHSAELFLPLPQPDGSDDPSYIWKKYIWVNEDVLLFSVVCYNWIVFINERLSDFEQWIWTKQ